MNRFVVTITFDKGKTICNPASVDVGPGDTVRWTCEEGALGVDFENRTPFTGTQVWAAAQDQLTPLATVKSDLVDKSVFQPRISINGTVVAQSQGDIIFRRK